MLAKPFIKWAGGKSQLIKEIKQLYPKKLGVEITKYCEPFVGGGAVLFDIVTHYPINEVLINDINDELINTYIAIKTNLNELILVLLVLQNEYWSLDTESQRVYYYQKRKLFNSIKLAEKDMKTMKAALFIFLNKTCFNGLYRVNKNNRFNVPIGSYKKPIICDKENLENVSRVLKNIHITCKDYYECASFIDENTFVYIDPPYRPISKTAHFTAYTKHDFDDAEQIRLSEFIKEVNNAGAKVVISNSDPKNFDAEDNFFDTLYASYNIKRINANRMINRSGQNRTNISELLINNY